MVENKYTNRKLGSMIINSQIFLTLSVQILKIIRKIKAEESRGWFKKNTPPHRAFYNSMDLDGQVMFP